MAFHSAFSKTKIEVEDVISSPSLDKTLISSIQWMGKCIKNTRNQTAHESGVWTVRISQKFTGEFFRREELYLKSNFWVWSLDEETPRDRRL